MGTFELFLFIKYIKKKILFMEKYYYRKYIILNRGYYKYKSIFEKKAISYIRLIIITISFFFNIFISILLLF